MASEDFLAQAALAALEGFERAYVPFKTREQEDMLARRRNIELLREKEAISGREFERESYIPTKEIPSSIKNVLFEGERIPTEEERLYFPKLSEMLGVPERVRKELIAPAVSLAGQKSKERIATEKINSYVPRSFYQYAGSLPDLTNKALNTARQRVLLDSKDPFSFLTSEQLQEKFETYFEEEMARYTGKPRSKPKPSPSTTLNLKSNPLNLKSDPLDILGK